MIKVVPEEVVLGVVVGESAKAVEDGSDECFWVNGATVNVEMLGMGGASAGDRKGGERGIEYRLRELERRGRTGGGAPSGILVMLRGVRLLVRLLPVLSDSCEALRAVEACGSSAGR